MGVISRIMLFIGAIIASIFVSKDAHYFDVLSFALALLFFTTCIGIAVMWVPLTTYFKRLYQSLCGDKGRKKP